ncbi:hypothetical protein Q8A67_005214 [Cirrhinus molitorella]|uniref:Ig-like domain-containing protein n=1 Tax=Cirrhinus molitorella TaxID=172907 RepID=A0AA88TVL5_9TELE|nr:hypothetical protein Q8A67_005214 [Cirrhinus molitorella]
MAGYSKERMFHLFSLISLLMIPVIYSQDWKIQYTNMTKCALKDSTVILSGIYEHPARLTVTERFWIVNPSQDNSKNLLDHPDYGGRVQFFQNKDRMFLLKLSNVTHEDEGMYCIRIKTNEEKQKYLGYPGVDLKVTDLRVEIPEEMIEGESPVLFCKTTCNLSDKTNFTWYKNGKYLSKLISTNQLLLQSVSRDDTGNYSCAVTDQKHVSPAVTLSIRYPPKSVSVSISPSAELVEGDSVTLSCSSDANPPALNFSWFKENQASAVGSGQSFSISSFNSSHSGRYYCEAQNKYGSERSASVSVTVEVIYSQDWKIKYTNMMKCALKDSTIILSGTYEHPARLTVTERFWTVNPSQDNSKNLLDHPDYGGRVQFFQNKDRMFLLKLSNVTHEDEGMYCIRIETNEEKQKYLGYPGVDLKVTDLRVEIPEEIIEGQSPVLFCKTTCNLSDKTNFTWYKNGKHLSKLISTNQLLLQSVSRDDTGNYSCAVTDQKHVSPAVTLSVRYPPKNVSVSVSPCCKIKEGDSVTLICSSDSNPPALNFSWFKENQSSAVGSGQSFSISSFNSSHSGRYYCEAQNKYGSERSASVSVTPADPPKSISVSISPSGEIVEGDSVTLICSSDSNPPAEISWYKGETFLKSGDSYSFTNIKSEASGNYKCSASNKHGSQTSTAVTVNVRYPPKSISVSINPSGEIVEGDSVTLICSSDSNPPAEFSWIKEGNSVESGQIYNISKISSDHKKESDIVTLNVMYKPRNVVVNLNSSEIVERDSVTLICSSDSNPPALNFIWFKENQSSSVGSGQSFSISSFNSSHSGRYYCEAQNKYGSERSASVSVKEVQRAALHTVTGIVVGCGGLIFILIIIIVFIKKKKRDGGAEVVRQNQEDRVDRSAEMALTNDDPMYSLVSDNQTDDLYANIKDKKPKRSGREQTEKDSGGAEEVQYASVHHFKNKDMKKTEKTIELQHLSDPNRSEDVIYSSVK